MILLIDNYDSFTYNLYQYLGEMDSNIIVRRNDEVNLQDVKSIKPSHIILSPGPGHPENAGICVDIIKEFSGVIPILGICLGHQAIGLAMGAKIGYAPQIVHGKASIIKHNGRGILQGIPSEFSAGRYHSLTIERDGFPSCLQIDGEAEDGTIMAIEHREHKTFGLQFHPESILTSYGKSILANFIKAL